MNRLDRSFYLMPTLDVAKNLLGKVIVVNGKRAVITRN
jgi:3-methyladenine DNA glycosylase Mpg